MTTEKLKEIERMTEYGSLYILLCYGKLVYFFICGFSLDQYYNDLEEYKYCMGYAN